MSKVQVLSEPVLTPEFRFKSCSSQIVRFATAGSSVVNPGSALRALCFSRPTSLFFVSPCASREPFCRAFARLLTRRGRAASCSRLRARAVLHLRAAPFPHLRARADSPWASSLLHVLHRLYEQLSLRAPVRALPVAPSRACCLAPASSFPSAPPCAR